MFWEISFNKDKNGHGIEVHSGVISAVLDELSYRITLVHNQLLGESSIGSVTDYEVREIMTQYKESVWPDERYLCV